MKTRNGFVSNSSSSSFIVAFNKKDLEDKTLEEVLYPKADKYRGVQDPFWSGRKSEPENYTAEEATAKIQAQWREVPSQELTNELESEVHMAVSSVGMDIWYRNQNRLWPTYRVANSLRTGQLKDTELGELIRFLDYTFTQEDEELLQEAGDLYNRQEKHQYPKESDPPEVRKKLQEAIQKVWEREEVVYKILTDHIMDHFFDNLKDTIVQVFSFSDNSGETSLEHGDTFRNVKHLRLSHH